MILIHSSFVVCGHSWTLTDATSAASEDCGTPHQHPTQQTSLQDSVDTWHSVVGSLGAHAEAITVVCTADRLLTSSLLKKMVGRFLEVSPLFLQKQRSDVRFQVIDLPEGTF